MLIFISQSMAANAGIISIFRNDDGHTNWQYVANWSSGIFILLLTITTLKLIITLRLAHKTNSSLEEIRNDLELRVQERTATLNESNQQLQNINLKLEDEVNCHKQTTILLRSSESYIQNILSSMPLMLIGLNQKGQITQWNHFSENISGVKTAQALGKDLWDTYPTIPISPDHINTAITQNESITINHSQRGCFCLSITIYPLQEHVEPGVVILIIDETKRIKTENMLIQKDKMSSMGELASTMAHDINPPLTAMLQQITTIKNQFNELRNKPSSIEQQVCDITNALDDASNHGQQAASIISNILSFSNAGGDEKHLADVSKIMDHALELAADMLSTPAKKFSDITLKRDYQANLAMIPCYAAELQQVFLSLFRHAWHALNKVTQPDHQPVITIQISECYDALWIKIQHNGIGLNNEEQQHIFEPFFGNNNIENQHGSDKRLSFSHFIITEHHQGQMALTSDQNVGTTFHMQIHIEQAS